MKQLFENIKQFFITQGWQYLLIGLICILAAKGVGKMGMAVAAIPLTAAFIFVFFTVYIRKIETGMWMLMFMSFATSLLTRYVPGPPYGLTIDIFLVLTLLIYFFKSWRGFNYLAAKNDQTLIWAIWMAFTVIEIANPLAASKEAWFYAMRGLSLYPLLMIPLAFILFKKQKHMEQIMIFIVIWGVIGAIWGWKQIFIGVSGAEQRWLDQGASSTHILFGKLRAFGYSSDAAQYGAMLAHIGFLAGIWAYAEDKLIKRILYGLAALLCFYGMILSGSRGPLVIPAAGGIVFLFFSKRFKLFFTGMTFGFLIFSFLKFTTIGNANSQIARMRTALNPSEDASFLVRKEREKVLKVYMADKPLGGGIGSAGFWGKRFTPGTFLAELGTDGHYTRIWMECGWVGLYLYIGLFIWVTVSCSKHAWKVKDDVLRFKIAGLLGSWVGLAVASYTNGLITQVPTGPIVYLSIVFIYESPKWDRAIAEQKAHEHEEQLQPEVEPKLLS